MYAFWLVLTYDLLKDRRIDDDSARFKFDSGVILWTNPNSLLSITISQFASCCIDNRLRQSAIFVSVKVAKFEIIRFFPYILILYYVKQIDSMLPCDCSVIDHRGRQNVVRTSVTHSAALRVPLFCSYHILTSSVIYCWTVAWQHGICLFNIYLESSSDSGITLASRARLWYEQQLFKGHWQLFPQLPVYGRVFADVIVYIFAH